MLATEPAPHVITLPNLSIDVAGHEQEPDLNVSNVVNHWLPVLESTLKNLKSDNLSELSHIFHPDGWWRDHLALSWDLRTVHGIEQISEYLNQNVVNGDRRKLFNIRARVKGSFVPRVGTPLQGSRWIESMFDFETDLGRGSGIVRLVLDSGSGLWQCYTISTTLLEVKGSEEEVELRRGHGGENSLYSLPGQDFKGNWQDHRDRKRDFVDQDPAVLVIGAGQSGLCIAARLEQMGVSTLIVDRNQRVGDNWRQRYRTLVTHDPVHYCHLPYVPFPINWPMFTPKDKLGDWFENYASIMELNIWMSSTVKNSSFDETTRKWTVEVVKSDGSSRILHPNHVVFCTGHSGEPKIPTFPSQSSFQGLIYHASAHRDASEMVFNTPSDPSSSSPLSSKRVLVIGTGNSGHDIAQNYYEAGAKSVTMLQRAPTYVISGKIGYADMHKGLYDEDLPPVPRLVEEADVYGQSLPIPVQFARNVSSTARIIEREKQILDGLKEKGFALTFSPAGSGLYRKYITDGGGYYIDVGCSQLIIDGKVGFYRCEDGIKHMKEDGVVLADGREIEADIVVCATGYQNMKTTVEKIMGKDIADRTKEVWDLDDEGEVRAIWRPSGHPNFWFMGGNLALCRHYSKLLALQIVGVERGLNKSA